MIITWLDLCISRIMLVYIWSIFCATQNITKHILFDTNYANERMYIDFALFIVNKMDHRILKHFKPLFIIFVLLRC